MTTITTLEKPDDFTELCMAAHRQDVVLHPADGGAHWFLSRSLVADTVRNWIKDHPASYTQAWWFSLYITEQIWFTFSDMYVKKIKPTAVRDKIMIRELSKAFHVAVPPVFIHRDWRLDDKGIEDLWASLLLDIRMKVTDKSVLL